MVAQEGWDAGVSEEPLTTNDRLTRLEGDVASIKLTQAQLGADVRQVLEKLSSVGKTNWALIFAAISVLVAIVLPTVGALAMFVSFSIRNAVSPLESKAEVSVRDRGELHTSVGNLTDLVTANNVRDRETTAEFRAKLTEIETQFLGADHIRNLQYANNLRYTALMWEKLYGQKFPSEIQFYPTISQHER